MIDTNLYFDVFNPSPFWQRAKSIIEGMRKTRPFIYENFELWDQLKVKWAKKKKIKYNFVIKMSNILRYFDC